MHTLWASAAINVYYIVIPETDDVFVLGAKTLREKLGVDVVESLKTKGLVTS